MTLKQLEAFYWAATCANFGIAAKRIHVSVSSLSKRLSELEESVGTSLFDRSLRKATLTEAGQTLLPHARGLLQAAATAKQSVGIDEGIAGSFRLGVGELGALLWLAPFISKCKKTYPSISLEPYVDVGAVLEQKLEKGELDFAVIAGRSSKNTILSYPVFQAEFLWVGSSKIMGNSSRLTHQIINNYPVISLPDGAGTTRVLDDWLLELGILAEKRIVCNSWAAIASMLIEGMGIGFLPTSWAQSLAKNGKVKVLHSQPKLNPLWYSFQWRRGDNRVTVTEMRSLIAKTANFAATSEILGF
jgi:DNA-binding transcriptional LysR family regulator